MQELKRIPGIRMVATPAALDAAAWSQGALALRLAPDEVFVIAPVVVESVAESIGDPHAIVVPDAGFVGVWLGRDVALDFLARTCEWEVPASRPAFAQGMVAGLPVKLWLEEERVLLITAAPYAHDLAERIG